MPSIKGFKYSSRMNMRSSNHPGIRSTRAQTRKSEAASKEDAALFAELENDHPYKDESQKCELYIYERPFNTRGELILLQSGCKTGNGEQRRSCASSDKALLHFMRTHVYKIGHAITIYQSSIERGCAIVPGSEHQLEWTSLNLQQSSLSIVLPQ